MLHRPLLVFVLAGLLSCTPTPVDPEPDPTPEPTPAPVFMGADPAVRAEAGEARAGIIRDGEAGDAAVPEGMAAEAGPGDFVLWNDQVRFVVQGAYPSHGYVDGGGQIIDADIVRPEGQLGRDAVDDMVLSFGVGRIVDHSLVEVVADGIDRGPAVVRAVGTDARWEMIHGVFESQDDILPPLNLLVTTEYRLEPGSWSIAIETTWQNNGEELAHFNPVDGFVSSAEDQRRWTADSGLASFSGADMAVLGVVGTRGSPALSFWLPDGDVRGLDTGGLLDATGIRALSGGWRDLEPGDSDTMLRYWSVGPDTLTNEAERWRGQTLVSQDLGRVSGLVSDLASGAPVAGSRVFVTSADDERTLGFATSGDDGAWSATLPVGDYKAWATGSLLTEHVDLPADAGRYGPFTAPAGQQRVLDVLSGAADAVPLPLAEGRPPAQPVAFSVSDGTSTEDVDAALEAGATLSINIEDQSGQPIGAVVELRWANGAPDLAVPSTLRAAFGLPTSGNPGWVWTGDGEVVASLLPGEYDLVVTHSWRHGRVSIEDVVLTSGLDTAVTVVLPEVVARDGWLAVDSHLHAAPSTDGKLPMEDRLITCAAAGVDLPINTDHDRMADYRPLNEALGLSDRMQNMPGVEISSVRRGHFNLFPVEPDPQGSVNGGALAWWDIPFDTDQHAERMKATGTDDSLLQINHGRGAGAMDFASFDHTIGEPRVDDFWTWSFELFELVNGRGRGNWLEERQDWFSWLDTGRRKVPTGVSDSHSRSSPCGYAHTDVLLDSTDPASVTPAALSEAFLAGHVVVSGGVTLRATLDGSLPGDVATGETATLAATVRAPDWIVPTVIRVWRNSEMVAEQVIDGPAVDGVWADVTWSVNALAEDAWFVVEVEGEQSLGSWWGGAQPYAITNALYLDAAGDGWDPPGR